MIQRIDKFRIFAQNMLKVSLSCTRFALLGCYIRKDK